jgi:hypothetical protein
VHSGGRGYAEPAYGRAFSELGSLLLLDSSGAQLFRRPVNGTDHTDAASLYPLLSCTDWSRLDEDLALLDADVVSVVAVTDPFADADTADLRASFPDLLRRYKEHYVTDLEVAYERAVSPDHRYKARRAHRSVDVTLVDRAPEHGETWSALYGHLIDRHGITGVQAFSESSLRSQLEVPGMHLWLAHAGAEVVAGQLWLCTPEVVYYHLAASTQRGYEVRASYALYSAAMIHYRRYARWLSLGAEPDSGGDGLRQFKRGWATGVRTAWLGGRISQPEVYRSLAAKSGQATGAVTSDYFPAYRRP